MYIEKVSPWIKIKRKGLETHINHAPTCVSLQISVKNHDTHTETGKFIYKALTFYAKQLFSDVIDQEATKVLYSMPPPYLKVKIWLAGYI